MHPAASIILFTTATGAGFGLSFWLALLVLCGWAEGLPLAFRLVALGLSAALSGGGLTASLWHLGHPERAWRALSQWRSSWLSREGVLAILSLIALAALGLIWGLAGGTGMAARLAAAACLVLAPLTVVATGMIYASLRPVIDWYGGLTAWVFLGAAGASGLGLLAALLAPAGRAGAPVLLGAAAMALVSGAIRHWHLRRNATLSLPGAAGAIGQKPGRLTVFEDAHTEANFVMKEMGYRVARKHAAKLGRIAMACAWIVPALAFALAAGLGPLPRAVLCAVAVAVQIAGILIDRWLFFATARHVVTLYYRPDGPAHKARTTRAPNV